MERVCFSNFVRISIVKQNLFDKSKYIEYLKSLIICARTHILIYNLFTFIKFWQVSFCHLIVETNDSSHVLYPTYETTARSQASNEIDEQIGEAQR